MNLFINHIISFLGVLLFAAGQGTAICEVISTDTSCPATNNLPDYPHCKWIPGNVRSSVSCILLLSIWLEEFSYC